MFDLDRFIADCSTAVRPDRTHKSVRELVSGVVSDPTAVLPDSANRGAPRCRGFTVQGT